MKIINRTPVYFTPPYIKNKDLSYRVSYVNAAGDIVRQYQDINQKKDIKMEGEPFLIGNGSLVELNVCVFDTKTKGKGHRLEGIRILDLIEYVPKEREEEVASEGPVEEVEEDRLVEVIAVPKKKASPF